MGSSKLFPASNPLFDASNQRNQPRRIDVKFDLPYIYQQKSTIHVGKIYLPVPWIRKIKTSRTDRGLDSSKAWNFYMACHNTLVPRWTFWGEILGGNKPVQLGTVSWGGKPAIFRLCSWCDFCIWNKKHFSCRCVECFFFLCVEVWTGCVCVCVWKCFCFIFG